MTAALLGGLFGALGATPALAAPSSAAPDRLPSLAASAPIAGSTASAQPPETGWVLASAYSSADGSAQGCPGSPPLRDAHVTVATPLVPCGHRLRICTAGGRCAIAVRSDSGPYAGGRKIDLNVGVVRLLGFSSPYAWGVRRVSWEPLGPAPPPRPVRRSASRIR